MSEAAITHSGAPARNLAIRIGTAAVALPLIVWWIHLSPVALWALLAVGIVVAAAEMAVLLRARRPAAPVFVALSAHALCFPGSLWLPGLAVVMLAAIVLEPAALVTLAVVALPLESLLLLRLNAGPGWVLLALAVTWLGDAGSYFIGRSCGKHKLAPTVSPGKTIEGAVGGIVVALGLAAVVGRVWLADVPLAVLLPLAVLANIAGQLGDLAESWLKRRRGIKDSGVLVPGYGGMLDKIDSLVAATPVLTLAVWRLGLAPRWID